MKILNWQCVTICCWGRIVCTLPTFVCTLKGKHKREQTSKYMKSLKENGTSRLVHEKAWRRSKDLKGKKIKAEFQKTVMLSIYILVFTIPYGSPHTSLIPKGTSCF
jgi:hypothetical protein